MTWTVALYFCCAGHWVIARILIGRNDVVQWTLSTENTPSLKIISLLPPTSARCLIAASYDFHRFISSSFTIIVSLQIMPDLTIFCHLDGASGSGVHTMHV
ncbi:hypothetical protein EV702DRAFT_1076900, partial [Suillus placidus]